MTKGARSESQNPLSFSRLRGNPEFNRLDLQLSAEDDRKGQGLKAKIPRHSRACAGIQNSTDWISSFQLKMTKGARSESQNPPSFSCLRGNPEVNQLDLQLSAEDDRKEQSLKAKIHRHSRACAGIQKSLNYVII